VGAYQYVRRGYAHPRMALMYGAPAIVGVYLSRRVVFPAIPDPVFTIPKDTFVMVIFAVFMGFAATKMIRGGRQDDADEFRPHRYVRGWIIGTLGLAVGVFAGFVGAGGGFMILPVLVLLGGLPMRMAIGTSLLIIAAQSLFGFVGEIQAVPDVDYAFVASIVGPAIAGIFVGTWINHRTPVTGLKRAFGWFLLIAGAAIIAREMWMS